MKRLPYLALGCFLFCIVNLPKDWADGLRGMAAFCLGTLWRPLAAQAVESKDRPTSANLEAIALRRQVEGLQEWLLDEKRLKQDAEWLALLLQRKTADGLQRIAERRIDELRRNLALRYAALPAQVIFRDPSSWSSTLWIDIGQATNRSLGYVLVARNSPVVVGHSLAGVIEYVGETQSRVKLITDAGLIPAVRVSRGGAQNRELVHHVQSLIEQIAIRSDLFSSAEEQEKFLRLLCSFDARVSREWEEERLAKGEMCGCSVPLWRSRGVLLKGTGFNYDYADEEGPAHELRTGQPVGSSSSTRVKPLLKEGDLLVTSGLDGVFPPGLHVAFVTKVFPLKEGSFTYELEARPTASDLSDVQTVFVLPPLGFESF